MELVYRESELRAGLRAPMGSAIRLLRQVDSTNDEAKRWALAGAPHGALVLAEMQTKGKGRKGNTWLSVPYQGIYMSWILRLGWPPEELPKLGIVSALAASDALLTVAEAVGIKWPNDVLIGKKKVCGILIESATGIAEPFAVVGVGFNARAQAFPEELSQRATSIENETGKAVDREALVCEFGEALSLRCQQLERGYQGALLREYAARSLTLGSLVRLSTGETGRAVDFCADGALCIETEAKETITVVSGEVSIRGMMGYV